MYNHYQSLCGGICRVFTLFCLFFVTRCADAQNSYPSVGDAIISSVTVGAGAGNYTPSNTALGYHAININYHGSALTGVGFNALAANYYGSNNTAVGNSCMSNGDGKESTGVGSSALHFNAGYGNVAVGAFTMQNNTSGSTNTALGNEALGYNTTGYSNVAVGDHALFIGSTGGNLVAVGDSALYNNTAFGNTAIGSKTLYTSTTGTANTALGYQGLYSNVNGSANMGVGFGALYSNVGGGSNAAFGVYAAYYTTSGSYNTAYGMEALMTNTTGSDNTAVGAFTGIGPNNLTNATSIGYGAAAASSNSVVIGNSSVTSIGGYAGWTNFSDGRYKKNINQNVPGLVFINKLTPITYTLDIDGIEATRQKAATGARATGGFADGGGAGGAGPGNGTGVRAGFAAGGGTGGGVGGGASPGDDPVIRQAMKEKAAVVYTGFIAQDVDKAAQSIGYNFSGVDKPKNDQQSFYGLRYSDFVVPLVKAVQELSVQNDSLRQANAQLSQRLDHIEQLLGLKTGGASGASGSSGSSGSSTLALSSARLFQNTPNPFNGTTVINYFVPQNSGVALLVITGMNGETIKSIALSGTGAGQVSVQTAQLAAGTYVYSLIVDGNLVDTKRMVVVK